jgi:O-antigen/teichoic acid export membrane protein
VIPFRSVSDVLGALRSPGQYRDTLFLISSTTFSAVGSLIYWKLITYRFDPVVMGLISVAISSAVFLSNQANIGLTVALLRFIPEQKTAASKLAIVSFTYLIGLFISLFLGLVFLGGREWWAPDLVPPETGWVYLFIFMILLISYCITNVNIAVLQVEMQTPYLLLQSAIINVIQIVGGWIVPIHFGVTGVLFTYTLPIVVVAVMFYFLIHRLVYPEEVALNFRLIAYTDLVRFSIGNLLFLLIWSVPSFIFPLIVLEQLGPAAAALLAITWYGFTFVAIIPQAAASNFMIYTSQTMDQLGTRLRSAMRLNFSLLLPVILFIVLFSPWLLLFFGPMYSQATQLLRLLTISCFPLAVNGLYLSLLRTQKKIAVANLLILCLTVAAVSLSYLLVNLYGLDGIGWGWLVGQTMFAIAILPTLYKEGRLATG